jgi:hypothetical protein
VLSFAVCRRRQCITDLGFSHFYFSCHNYQETALASITKVVVLFTKNPTKLGLHFSEFSTIFYGFYKIQHLHLDLEETVLRTGPRISQTSPRDGKLDCNWVLGAMGGGGSSIPTRGRLGSAGKGRGSGVGSPRVPFRGLLAPDEQPAAVLGDVGGWWPQGASAPACWPATLRHRQLSRLQRGCGVVEEGSSSKVRDRKVELGSRLQWWAAGSVLARGGCRAF